uniref:C-type lectin domain-containing protein n=1 Tax=Ciona intestinalis TaxID=7719 RepID=F6YSZ2_CIOIN
MRVVAMLLILSAVTFTAESTVRNQYMVCRSVEGIYDPNQEIQQSNATSVRGPMGKPGKRGPRGLQGPKGSQGPTGLQGLPGSSAAMNWTEIDRRIQVAMQNYMREMQQHFTIVRMPSTASTLPTTSTTVSTVTATMDVSDCDGVAYHGRCIWLPFLSSGNGRKERAESVCNQGQGTLVDIESEEMFNVVYNYVKTSYNSGLQNSVIVWLASTLENDGVRQSRGNGATYTKWYSNRRVSWRPQINCLVFSVNTKPTKQAYGMIAVPPYFPRGVPLCISE